MSDYTTITANLSEVLVQPYQIWLIVFVLIFLMAYIIWSIIWAVRNNMKTSLLLGLIKLNPCKSTLEPAAIKQTQAFLKASSGQLKALRKEVLSEIRHLTDNERQLTERFNDSNLSISGFASARSAIDRSINERKHLKQEIVSRLEELKNDCRKVESLLEKVLNNAQRTKP